MMLTTQNNADENYRKKKIAFLQLYVKNLSRRLEEKNIPNANNGYIGCKIFSNFQNVHNVHNFNIYLTALLPFFREFRALYKGPKCTLLFYLLDWAIAGPCCAW